MSNIAVLVVAGLYLYLLFAVAFFIDRRGKAGFGRLDGWIYGLSIAVYCTSWTFYGSVGRATEDGIRFLAIYIGPVLVFVFGQHLLRKILRIAHRQHITSIADFISARYGKSQGLAGLVTIIAVIGIVPYISLQLKAVSSTLNILVHYPSVVPQAARNIPPWADTTFYLTLLMALFVIAFGTRSVDATEQHRGMVAAVALESLVKLAAFLCAGVYVTYGMFDGFGDLLARAAEQADIAPRLDFGEQALSTSFWTLTALAAAAIICLPRQFQVTVIENNDERHLATACRVFPAYLVLINIFVLPIALAGLLTFPGQGVSPDTFVLTLPIAAESRGLAVLVFIGGLSAATGMIIVETIALATMVCNDLVMPLLIRAALLRIDSRTSIGWLVKGIRRAAILFVLLLGYAYVRLVGESYALVSIGLVSFCAAAQFAPAIIGGVFWRRGNRIGAIAGLAGGFAVWIYTLLLPSFARSGWLPTEFASEGIFFIEALRPYALFGLSGLDPISHSLLWSMLFNVGGYVLFSLWSKPGAIEQVQAEAFVDAFGGRTTQPLRAWSADIAIGQMMALVGRFVDPDRAHRAYADYAEERAEKLDHLRLVDQDFVNFSERLLAGAIGSALARMVIASTIREREMSLDGVMEMLSGATQAIEMNLELTRETFDSISQGVSMFDADLRLAVWNRRFMELLNFPPHLAIVGTPLEAFFRHNAERGEYGPGDVETQVAERMALALRRESHVFERIRPDGSVLEIRGRSSPSGGMVTTYTDVTERKRAELELQAAHDELERRIIERTQDLRNSEERFRDLAESASDWFWETDAELRFTYISGSFFETTGLIPAQMLGSPCWDPERIGAIERDAVKWRRHRNEMAARLSFRHFEYTIAGCDGRTHHVRISGKPYRDATGNFLGYRGTGSDISQLVEAQNELLHSEKLAALGALVAGVAHEINTPVGIGLTAASYLQEKLGRFRDIYSGGKVRRSDIDEFVDAASETTVSLLTNLRRAAELVRSFKQVAVDQSSEVRRRFNVKQYLGELLLSLRPKLKRTSHELVIEGADDIEIDSYPGAFSQIITNLVMNSLVHGFENKERGRIAIAITLDGGDLMLRYSDNGKGMAPATLSRLFEPFFTTRRGLGGSGLGMHVVYNLVTGTLRGRIEATSKEDEGVAFTLRIPLEQKNEASDGNK